MCKNPISIIIRIQHNIKVLPEILKACEQTTAFRNYPYY